MINATESLGYRPRSSGLTRRSLTSIRRKLIRTGAWFRRLNTVERGILDLTIECVERVKSPSLADTLRRILVKVSEALKSQFLNRVWAIGEPLAQQASRIARSWGNLSSVNWARDTAFIQYLGVMRVSTLRMPILCPRAAVRREEIATVIDRSTPAGGCAET